jgi:integrase
VRPCNRHGSKLLPDTQIGNHGLHNWWYARLEAAGIVATGVTKGERMHKGRHTAGQSLLDATGNLKAVQKLLRHKSIMTTADVYLDWDLDQLAQSLADALKESE